CVLEGNARLVPRIARRRRHDRSCGSRPAHDGGNARRGRAGDLRSLRRPRVRTVARRTRTDARAVMRAADLIDALNEWIGRGIAWCTLAMVLVTFAIVVMRYAFGAGS